MAIRKAQATWDGTLREGRGSMKAGSGAFEGPYTFASRFEEGKGTNPEELIGAAHAGCFSMALSGALVKAGFDPQHIQTQATVYLGKVDEKSRITKIHLDTVANVPGISQSKFGEIAEAVKTDCPVSAALTGVDITLDARLEVVKPSTPEKRSASTWSAPFFISAGYDIFIQPQGTKRRSLSSFKLCEIQIYLTRALTGRSLDRQANHRCPTKKLKKLRDENLFSAIWG